MKWKRKNVFPQCFKIDIRTSEHDIKQQIYKEFLIDVDPKFISLLDSVDPKFISLLDSVNEKKKKHTNQIFLDDLQSKLVEYVEKNFRRYSEDDIERLREITRNNNNYSWDPAKLCFFNIPQDFAKKWGLQTKEFTGIECLCRTPYYNYHNYHNPRQIKTAADFYNNAGNKSACIRRRCNGPIIQPLLNELVKYGIDVNNDRFYL